uniref:Uncharacterized protein n=1 Tax=Meloidogyne enterolobii TaxID=390850 RepID=A0A6V7XU87_MELEN|nr:unnamed protein product [Meloidogyne enterolobii]
MYTKKLHSNCFVSRKMPAIHFCSIQLNITEDNCCQLIKLLNIPEKIPFCFPKLQENISNNNLEIKNQNHTLEDNNSTFEATSLIFNNISTTLFPITSSPPSVKYGGGAPAMPVMNLKHQVKRLKEHLTFLFGIFMLISMAVICTLFLMKLAKVNSIQSSTSTIPPRLRFSPRDFARSLAAVDYSLMLCIPRSTSTNSNISNNSKEKNKKIEFASRELSEDEWQGKTEFDVKLNKNITSYINSSKKYPVVVVVKAVPNICCEVCHQRKLTRLNTKAQKLHMMPSCKVKIIFLIQKLKNNRKKRSNRYDEYYKKYFINHEPPPPEFLDENWEEGIKNYEEEEINNCSDREVNVEEEGPSHTSSPIIINNGDRCPVRDCKTFVQLKKHGSGSSWAIAIFFGQ